MKTATVKEIKTELKDLSHSDLMTLCLQLSKFKKENKELLTYLLFQAYNEDGFIESIKIEIDDQFDTINLKSKYFIRKSVRKILRTIKKYIRYSNQKETEIELLIYFCKKLKTMNPTFDKNLTLFNIYSRQIELIKKKIMCLHEDLQFDYEVELKAFEFIE
jgi:hypothetical protein